MTSARKARAALRRLANPVRAKAQANYLQAFKGGYGEGDRFLGLTVPQVQEVAREMKGLEPACLAELLRSSAHEDRSLALTIISSRFARASAQEQKALYDVFMKGRAGINNWDLVDGAAPAIVGAYLFERDRKLSFKLATLLLDDEHDLMHKAVGWMLREIGKRDLRALERHLESHGDRMPRTMLRYAIEHMTPSRRKYFMGLKAARPGRASLRASR